jgi:hypothetical protein
MLNEMWIQMASTLTSVLKSALKSVLKSDRKSIVVYAAEYSLEDD